MNRRDLMKNLLAGMAIPLAPINVAAAAKRSGRRLILVELSGANDGLNTVIPIKDERYFEIRPNIAMPKKEVFDFGNDLTLHGSLQALDPAIQAGDLAIIQGLGYPGQNRSHFKSIALWETGGDGSQSGKNGWLTEDLEKEYNSLAIDAHGISLDGGMGVFLSSSGVWLSMTSMSQFTTLGQSTEKFNATLNKKTSNPALSLIMDRGNALNSSMDRISKKIRNIPRNNNMKYDAGEFGRQAAMAAQLIDAGLDAPVLKLKLDGFDTHEHQIWQHRNLLRDLGRGLSGLRNSLIQSGHWENTLIMTYSEFGRRAVENQSDGTDHGTAAPHFMLSGAINGGIWGVHPDLGDLVEGDMKFTLDYRSVYQTILSDWFGLKQNRFSDFNNNDLIGLLA